MSIDPKTSRISVIIPTLNEEEALTATLAPLLNRPGLELIVVDGGSTDGTCALALAAGARLVSSASGRGLQQKVGAGLAGGEIFLFLHADTVLPDDCDRQIREMLSSPEVALGAFKLAIAAPGRAFRLIETFANCRASWCGLPYGDQALFMRAELYRQVGGFAEMPLLEDVDLVRRLAKKGRVVLAGSAARCSARRWLRLGLLRTTLLNQVILLGFFLGLNPFRLARWYRRF